MINMTDKYVLSGTGKPVRVLCVDAGGEWPVVALSDGELLRFAADGLCDPYGDYLYGSLIPEPKPNVVEDYIVWSHSLSLSKCNGAPHEPTKLGTIRITRNADRTKMISVEMV